MTLQEHFERWRRSVAELKLGDTRFADIGRTGRDYADRALAGLGGIDVGGLLTDLAVAIAFYTRLPLRPGTPVDGAALARASWCAPLVGALIGALAGLAYWIAWRLNLPPLVSATLAVAAGMLLTGCLHEDGLADTADGFGGGDTPERKLDIMRDSRIGAYGVCALVVSILIRAGALASIADPGLVAWALLAAHGAGRATLPAFMSFVGPARRDGLSVTAGQPPREQAIAAAVLGVLILLICLGFVPTVVAAILLVIATALLARLSIAQIGGQTGDVLGALEQTSEVVVLLVAAA